MNEAVDPAQVNEIISRGEAAAANTLMFSRAYQLLVDELRRGLENGDLDPNFVENAARSIEQFGIPVTDNQFDDVGEKIIQEGWGAGAAALHAAVFRMFASGIPFNVETVETAFQEVKENNGRS